MDPKKYILAFDTAMGACSCAVYDMELSTCKVKMSEAMHRGQAERLIPMIDETLAAAGVSYKDLALITCTHGPGAFTGLRLSLATAKALALSLDIPAIGVSTLECIAATALNNNPDITQPLLVCLETKRQDYYIQGFSSDLSSLGAPESADIHRMIDYIATRDNWHFCGDALERLQKDYPAAFQDQKYMTSINAPAPEVIVHLAHKIFEQNALLPKIEPLYLRAPDVSVPNQ